MTTPTPERAAQPQSRGEHTAGPWAFVNAPQAYIRSQNPGYNPVCDIIHDEDLRGIREPLTEEQKSNARLIAAAPELLAACKLALVFMPIEAESATAKLSAAISKAEQPQ